MTGHTDARGGHAVEMDTGRGDVAGQGMLAGHGPAGSPRRPRRPGRWWTVFVSCLALTFVLLAAYDLASGGTGAGGAPAAAGSGSASRGSASSSAAGTSSASGAGTGSASSSTTPGQASSAAPQPLPIAAISAFGPRGTSDGDNPGIVSRVNGTGTRPWYSLWYATRGFGNLQAGTGLLLDMGAPVTVSGVRLTLGSQPGTTLQVRTGDAATVTGLTTVATAADVGGTVWVPVTDPVAARYVLIWFTELPPDGQGTYQASVYNAAVEGTAGT